MNHSKTTNEIIEEIYAIDSEYRDIFFSKIVGNDESNMDLFHDIIVYLMEDEEKLYLGYKEGWLKYFFVSIVSNQYNSNTSKFYKLYKRPVNLDMSELEFYYFDNNLEFKEKRHKEYLLLKEVLKEVDFDWIEKEMFRLYYNYGLSLREIERKVGINYNTVYVYIRKCREKIKNKLKENIFNKNIKH